MAKLVAFCKKEIEVRNPLVLDNVALEYEINAVEKSTIPCPYCRNSIHFMIQGVVETYEAYKNVELEKMLKLYGNEIEKMRNQRMEYYELVKQLKGQFE